MTETHQDAEEGNDVPPAKRQKRRPRRLGLWFLWFPLLVCVIAGLGYLTMSGRPVSLPAFVADRIEAELGRRTGGTVEIDDVVLDLNTGGLPRVELHHLTFSGADGARLGEVNTITARLASGALKDLKFAAHSLEVSGAQITVRRAADGSFGLGLGGGAVQPVENLGAILGRADDAMADSVFSRIGEIRAEDLTLTLEDVRSGRVWKVTDGQVDIKNGTQATEITIRSEVFNGTENLAGVQLSFTSDKGSRQAILSARIEDAPARDIALQAPALSFMGALDALVSGAMRVVVASDGSVESFDASLDIGEGALRPTEAAQPVPFNRGRAYMSYDPGQKKISFSELFVEGDSLRLAGAGHAYLQDFSGAWPDTLLAQVNLSEITAAPEGMFDNAVTFSRGVADLRLRLDPFSVEFGQVMFEEGDQRVTGQGLVQVTDAGWVGSVDISADELTPDRLLALWPVSLISVTRGWLQSNLLDGRLSNVEAALRLLPDSLPRVGVTFGFEDGVVRFLPHMPPISSVLGHAALIDNALTVTVAEGEVRDPLGETVDLSGSTFQIADVFARPGRAKTRLELEGRLPPVLRIMDNRPFEVLSDNGLSDDLAEANVRLRGVVEFPTGRDLVHDDVDFEFSGTLEDARSDTLVDGRVLSADRLQVEIVPDLLRLSGLVDLDGLAFDAEFRQPIGPDSKGTLGRIAGTVALGDLFFDTVGIDLPPGSVSGAGSGEFTLNLARAAPPEFTLQSTLEGLAVSIPAIGWRKSAGTSGSFEIGGRLGQGTEVDRLRLSGPGLDAEGTLEFGDSGAVGALTLDRLVVGRWFDAPVRLRFSGNNRSPRIEVRDGTIDLRNLPDNGGSGGSVPVSLALDALVISDTLALTGFTSDLEAGQGVSGRFRARVNGGTVISGDLVPQRGRTAIRVQGDDAGAVLRDARIFKSLDGGRFDLVLSPRQGAPGFDGQMNIDAALLGDQSVLVDMLDAVSVVGIIDQLRGPGVLFDAIEARFRLTSDQLTLTSGSAVGASLGVSLDGVYDIANERLDMQGVLSPLYLLNAVGQIFTRRGEGLFGFTFRLRGDADNPRITVNPLSILTPGMFREIFRRPPPVTQ